LECLGSCTSHIKTLLEDFNGKHPILSIPKNLSKPLLKRGMRPFTVDIYFKNQGKSSRMSLPTKSVYQQNFPSHSRNKPFIVVPSETDNTKTKTLKCWSCGDENLLRDYPHRKQNNGRVYNVQEATKINDVARSLTQIYAALGNRVADH